MRKPSITQEFRQALVEQQCFGRSKKQDKMQGISTKGKIYSFNSYKNYKEQSQRFARWAKSEGAKDMASARKYIVPYLHKCEASGVSPSTIWTYASAICKAYQISTNDLAYSFRERKRADITRSRNEVAEDKLHRQDASVTNFCRNTGLRRSELENTRGSQLEQRNGQFYVVNVKGKGGRIRDVPILNNDAETIQVLKDAGDKKIFDKKVTNTVNDVHALRREYAQAMYRHLAEPIEDIHGQKVEENGRMVNRVYACRCDGAGIYFDRVAMLEVSEAMGHSRSDIIARNYLI